MTHDQRALLAAAAHTTDWISLAEGHFLLSDARLLAVLGYGEVGVCPKYGARTFRISMAGVSILENA